MNDNPQKMPPVPPFVRFVASAVPMVFDNSLSYYEALCALWKYIQDMSDVVNNNATLEEEFIDKVNELEVYMNTYFDNLDVQEEINNKLDAMADAGTLADIISQYLNSTAVFGYDTVADMKSAANLTNGSYARTLGYHSRNDGGDALYKIRTIINDDVVDERKIIALDDDTLIAELVVEDVVDVKKCGVKGDGTTDETSLIQDIIDEFPNKTIFFPKGTYIISSHIDTPANNDKAVCLKLDEYAVIKAKSTYSDAASMIVLGGKSYDDYHLYDDFASFGIEGGTIDCNGVAGGVTAKNCVRPYIRNITIRNVSASGILLTNGANSGSLDASVQDCVIICANNTTAYGVNVQSSDNWIQNVRTFSGKYGFYFESAAGNHLTETHALATSRDYTVLSDAQNMCAYYFKTGGGNYNYLNNAYSDGFATAFYFDGQHNNFIRDAYVYYWNEDTDTNHHYALYYSSTCTGRVSNLHCRFPSTGTNTILYVATKSSVDGWLKDLTVHNTANLNDANDSGYDPRFNLDTQTCDNNSIVKIGHDGDTLTIDYNAITVQDHVVNLNFAFKGLTLATGNAAALRLPEGYRPASNVNLRVFPKGSPISKSIVGYISSSGAISLNPSTAIPNTETVQIMGSYRNN